MGRAAAFPHSKDEPDDLDCRVVRLARGKPKNCGRIVDAASKMLPTATLARIYAGAL